MLANAEKIVLTDANIRNSYIRISQLNSLISEQTRTSEDKILLELEGVGKIETQIDKKKGIFVERKAIKSFFQIHELKPGEEIGAEKISENHFLVTTDCNKKELANSSTSKNIKQDVEIHNSSREQLALFEPAKKAPPTVRRKSSRNLRRANDLNGKEWTSNSISVWRDIRKTSDEKRLEHPAMFPIILVKKIIQCFTTSSDKMILDPFMGSGSTLVGACSLGRKGVGFEIYKDYIELATQRLNICTKNTNERSFEIYPYDALKLRDYVKPNSIDFCFTSPPYWDILTQRRTADYKEVRNYGASDIDLGRMKSYTDFIEALGKIFSEVLKVLKPGKYCVINVMDLRKKSRFYPFHADLSIELENRGYIFDDLIIWDRSHEYNNLRPLGYPSVFRINKVHEYLLIFQKARSKESGKKEGEKHKS